MTQHDQDLWDKAQQQSDPYNEPTLPFPQAPVPPPPTPSYGQEMPLPGTVFYQGMPNQGAVPPAMVSPGTTIQKKPSDTRRLLIIAAGILVLLLLGVGGFVLLPALTAKANNQAGVTSTSASTPATTGQPANKNVYAPYLANYRTSIRGQIAQGLHLSLDQFNTQLEAGKTLSSIATAQGISSSQLQALVTTVFQKAFQPTIDSQELTQKQVDALIKRMIKQPQVLDRYLMVRVKKGAATPTP